MVITIPAYIECERHHGIGGTHFRTIDGKTVCWGCLTPAEKAAAPCECQGAACRATRGE